MKSKPKCETIRAFNKAAAHYDAHAFVQKTIANRLLERLAMMKDPFMQILDAGCGTGYLIPAFKKLYPKSEITAVDIAFDMLKQAKPKKTAWLEKKARYINADLEQLPFQDNQFDLVFSNLALHWCTFDKVVESLKRVLKPGGLLLFTVPGPDTLSELLQTFQAIDPFAHVNDFLDMHDVGDVLQRFQFQSVVMDMEKITFEYNSLWDLLRDLKYTGVRNIHPNRRKHVTPRAHFDKLTELYPQRNHQYPITFEVIYGYAVCPAKQALPVKKGFIPLKLLPTTC